MGQVPSYAIIGNGRVARHFCHYFDLLQLSYVRWWRGCSAALTTVVSKADRVLLLITDYAIVPFVQNNSALQNKTLIHFSGNLVAPFIHGAHPLMMFTDQLYALDIYAQIPFVLEHEKGVPLNQLLPGIPNPSYYLAQALKPYYHSLCVLSGNFTYRLWQSFFKALEHKLQLPREIGYLYLEQMVLHLRANPNSAPSGPLARKDWATIEANLAALRGDPLQKIYQAFLEEAGYEDKCS